MPSFQSIFIVLVTSATIAQAEHLRAVWSSGHFSTITGPHGEGGGSGHNSGLTILNDDGDEVYAASYPYDYSPCFSSGNGGRTFAIDGDCWDTPFQFHCVASFGGDPESCAVNDSDGNELGSGEGKTDTTFIGVAIGIQGTCVVEFESNGGGCPGDNTALFAQGKNL